MESLSRWMIALDRVFSLDFLQKVQGRRWGPFVLESRDLTVTARGPGESRAFVCSFTPCRGGIILKTLEVDRGSWPREWEDRRILDWIHKRLARWNPEPEFISLGCFLLAGTSYKVKSPLKLRMGDLLMIRRDRENPHDTQAVEAATLGGASLGYLSRAQNQIPARLIDAGKTLMAKVRSWDGKRIGVELFLMETAFHR